MREESLKFEHRNRTKKTLYGIQMPRILILKFTNELLQHKNVYLCDPDFLNYLFVHIYKTFGLTSWFLEVAFVKRVFLFFHCFLDSIVIKI